MNIKENKKTVQGLETGIHLTTICKVAWALDTSSAEKKILQNKEGDKGFEMHFADSSDATKVFKNIYWLGGEKQKYFESVLSHIGINPKGKIVGKEIIGKQIWIAICEVIDIIGDEIQTDITGEEKKQHFIFKTFPFIEGGNKPYMEGDPTSHPQKLAMFEFRKYRDVEQAKTDHPKTYLKKDLPEEKPKTAMQPNQEFQKVPPYVEKDLTGQRGIINTPDEEPNFGEPVTNIPNKSDNTDEPNFGDEPAIQQVGRQSRNEITPKTNVNDVWDDEPNF